MAKVAELMRILGLFDPKAELDGAISYEGGELKMSFNLSKKVDVVPLEVVDHVNSGELMDHDDIDMSDWESDPGCRKSYYPALGEDDDPVTEFGELVGSCDVDWQSRNSFEFNRVPLSREEAEKAVADYLS